MLRLTLLGAVVLEHDEVLLDVSARRRRLLALLALLAAHGSHGLTRDKLLAFLWPESDTRHARNSLKQALYGVRHSIGANVLTTSGDVIRLDPAAIQVDVWEFEAAMSSGKAAIAVSRYGGPFLDGFYISGLAELEEWVEEERRRLERRYAEALRTLAQRSGAAGHVAASVHWWRLVAAAEPLSASGALGLMRALVSAGETAAALEHARVYEATVEAQLGVAVDEEVGRFAEHLRRPAPKPAAPLIDMPRQRLSPQPRAVRAAVAMADTPPVSARPVVRPKSPVAVLLPLILATVLAGLVSLSRREPTFQLRTQEPARLTVLPFETLGAGPDTELGRGLDALVASGIGDLEGYRLVPAAISPAEPDRAPLTAHEASADAERVGARFYVTGRLIQAPGGLRASAVVRDRANADQEVAHAEAEVGPGELFDLADQLVRGLVDELYRGPGQDMVRAAAAATRSLPALKAYLAGERALHAQDYTAARDAFRLAFRADTTFALAYFRCSIAADRVGDDQTARWSADLAARFSDRLSEHDRRLVTAYIVARRGMYDEAERLYRGILADYPQDIGAWFQLGELLAHANPLRGRSVREARSAFERVLAAEPDHGEALVHLARIAALDGRAAEADSLLRRAGASPAGGSALVQAAHELVVDSRPSREQVLRDLLTPPRPAPERVILRAAATVHDLEGIARLGQGLTGALGTCDIRAFGHRLLAQVAMARGQAELFRRELDAAAPCEPGAALELRALMAVQPFAVPHEGELAELGRRLRLAADTTMAWPSRAYYGGLVALRGGDTLAAGRYARALLRTADTSGAGQLARTFGRSLGARLRLAAHRPAQALAQLEAAGWERGAAQRSVAEVADRFLRADLLHRLGRDEEAIGWYGSIAERAPYELAFLAPAELRLARIYEGRGEAAQAAVHYARFGELWRDADRELRAPGGGRRGDPDDLEPSLKRSSVVR